MKLYLKQFLMLIKHFKNVISNIYVVRHGYNNNNNKNNTWEPLRSASFFRLNNNDDKMKRNVNKTGTQSICIVTFCGAVINVNKMILLSRRM